MRLSIHDLHANRHAIADIFRSFMTDECPEQLEATKTNKEAFNIVFAQYPLLSKDDNLTVIELETLSRKQLAPWYIWLFRTYFFYDERPSFKTIIGLHERLLSGGNVEEHQWVMAAQYALPWAARTSTWGPNWGVVHTCITVTYNGRLACSVEEVWRSTIDKLFDVLTAPAEQPANGTQLSLFPTNPSQRVAGEPQ